MAGTEDEDRARDEALARELQAALKEQLDAQGIPADLVGDIIKDPTDPNHRRLLPTAQANGRLETVLKQSQIKGLTSKNREDYIKALAATSTREAIIRKGSEATITELMSLWQAQELGAKAAAANLEWNRLVKKYFMKPDGTPNGTPKSFDEITADHSIEAMQEEAATSLEADALQTNIHKLIENTKDAATWKPYIETQVANAAKTQGEAVRAKAEGDALALKWAPTLALVGIGNGKNQISIDESIRRGDFMARTSALTGKKKPDGGEWTVADVTQFQNAVKAWQENYLSQNTMAAKVKQADADAEIADIGRRVARHYAPMVTGDGDGGGSSGGGRMNRFGADATRLRAEVLRIT
jgi:hypothetical protein